MVKKGLKTNVTPMGIQVILWSIFVFIVIDSLAKFGIIDLTARVSPIFIPITASLFVLADIAILQIVRGRKKVDVVDSIALIVAVVSLVSVVLTMVGLEFAALSAVQGIIGIALGISVLTLIFKK